MKNKKENRKNAKLSMTNDTFVRTAGKAIVAASVVGVTLLGTVTPAVASPAPKAVKILDAKTGNEVTEYQLQSPDKNEIIQKDNDDALCTGFICSHHTSCTGVFVGE